MSAISTDDISAQAEIGHELMTELDALLSRLRDKYPNQVRLTTVTSTLFATAIGAASANIQRQPVEDWESHIARFLQMVQQFVLRFVSHMGNKAKQQLAGIEELPSDDVESDSQDSFDSDKSKRMVN